MTNKRTSEINSLLLIVFIMLGALTTGCSSDDGHPRLKEFDEKTVHESTQGVETEVEEQEPGEEYLILDERLIDDKEASRAIVHNLDGTIDTLSFAKINSESESRPRYSALRGILMYGVARSFFSRNMGNVSPDPKAYKTPGAYNKATGTKNSLMSSSRTRTVRTPKGASSGYGKGRSFRSFGG